MSPLPLTVEVIAQIVTLPSRLTWPVRLRSPSVAGAYEFVIRGGEETTLDVDAHLWFRNAVDKVGVAPMTSMWQWDETNRPAGDFRPEVHDSDGLLVQDGADWIWKTSPACGRASTPKSW